MLSSAQRLFSLYLTGIAIALIAHSPQAQPTPLPPSPNNAVDPQKTTPATLTTQPNTVILSDTLHYDDIKNTSVFKGHVIMTRGFMTLHADELQTYKDAQDHQYSIALANPGKRVIIRREHPDTFETIQGKGRRVEYDDAKSQFDLIGQAEVIRYICGKPFDTIRGQRVRYNEKLGTYFVIGGHESAEPSGRVRSVLEPRARSDAAIAECRQTQARQKAPTRPPQSRPSNVTQ